MSLFTDLCNIATSADISFKVAVALNAAIEQTEEGKECLRILKQYNDGLLSLAEFSNAFIAAALSKSY